MPEGDRVGAEGPTMGRQDIIDHIEAELDPNTECDTEDQSQPTLCQQCGMEIIPATGAMPSEHGDYVVHRVPGRGEGKMRSIFYCSPSCFTKAMTALFSPTDE